MEEKRGYSAVLYGPPLVGKTTTLANDPRLKTCLIDFDKNSTTIEEQEHVTIIGVDEIEDYYLVKEAVRSGVLNVPGQAPIKMDFDLYVIDSFTSMEEAFKRHVVKKYAPNRKREIASKFGAQSDWGDMQDLEIAEVRDWQGLTKRPGNPINVLWIGHDMLVKDDMGRPTHTAIMLQGNFAAPRIVSAVDAVFYMIKTPDPEKPNVVHRGIYTIDHGMYRADARIAINRRSDLKPQYWDKQVKWGDIFYALGYDLPE